MYCSLLHRLCLKNSRSLRPTVWHVEYFLVRNLLFHVVSFDCVVCIMTHCWVHAVDAELLLCCQYIAWHAVRAVEGAIKYCCDMLAEIEFTLQLAVRSLVLISLKKILLYRWACTDSFTICFTSMFTCVLVYYKKLSMSTRLNVATN